MNSLLLDYFLEDDDDKEFEDLLDTISLPKTLLKNDELIYRQIESTCIDLALKLSQTKDEELSTINVGGDSDEGLNYTSNSKRSKAPPKRVAANVSQETANQRFARKRAVEYIDSDVDDEQIEMFLRSRKKKRLSKKLDCSGPDPRDKIMELRLVNHFEDKCDEEFFRHLRVTKKTFDYLLMRIREANLFYENYAGGNFPVQAEQALQMFLYYMGQKCTYKFLSQMYHISESAIMTSFMKCVEGINRLDDKEVRWPSTPEELRNIQKDFEGLANFPGIIGSIGGCCIEMRTNKEPPAGYKIGKLRSIMYLLAVTDAQLRFIYIQAGFPGTFCLQEAFESSSLGEMMKTNSSSLFVDDDTHLIGNSDLNLHKHLLVPYSHVGMMNEPQNTFNKSLNSSYVCDKAFAYLKNRFTSLRSQVYANLEKIPNIIKACCIIHNIAMKDSDDKKYLSKDFTDMYEDYSAFRDDSDFTGMKADKASLLKRERIAERICDL